MQTTFQRKAPIANAMDAFAICDLAGFAALAESVPASNENRQHCTATRSWTGCKDYNESLRQVKEGDLSGVAASDALLDKIEAESFLTQKWQVRHDVVGGVPNVGAFLAGHPLNMRRRERQLCEQGPLTIFASLELSAGIDINTMRKRGAAVLALVRLLSNSRPVDLYVCCGIGGVSGTTMRRGGRRARYHQSSSGGSWGAHVLVKIDTTPLDLARAAHVLTCPSVTRGLSYAVCGELAQRELGQVWGGAWAYNDHDAYRNTVRENYKTAVNPTSEALLLPAAHASDPCVSDPLTWLRNMLSQYGGLNAES